MAGVDHDGCELQPIPSPPPYDPKPEGFGRRRCGECSRLIGRPEVPWAVVRSGEQVRFLCLVCAAQSGQSDAPTKIVHRCPNGGADTLPCCGKSLEWDVPQHEGLTLDDAAVTCNVR